jgi:SpoVK/Ycf46/Vps4 family AAA+-type ATPase
MFNRNKEKNFRCKDLKAYSSKEWFVSKKLYRTVYDKSETKYIGVEFSFYNILFDEEDWSANISFKCYKTYNSGKKEICHLKHNDVKISKEENVVSVRDSWGKEKPGSFWEEGNYVWEAYVEGEFIISEKFYVYDVGLVSNNNNPYFDLISLKLYNGPKKTVKKSERIYLKRFNRNETKYVWIELQIKNKFDKEWHPEIFFYIYDNAGHLKGKLEDRSLIKEKQKNKIFLLNNGWGNTSGNTYMDDNYRVDVVFMNCLIASIHFEVSEEKPITGVPTLNTSIVAPESTSNKDGALNLEESMSELQELIGLNHIKNKIKEHLQYIEFLKFRKESGFEETQNISLHSVFTGNPGTGKTTVVKKLGNIYHALGLLSKGHVVEVNRADIVGQFIGQTAPLVEKVIKRARGGILFVDEAYSLSRGREDKKDFGREVIEILLKEMSDGPGDIAIMVAGYPKPMEGFLNSNPGLKSRFNYHYHFEDYLPKEMLEIAEFAAQKKQITLSLDSLIILEEIITEAYRSRDESFGNARFVFSTVEESKMNMGLRLMRLENFKELSKEELSLVKKEDVALLQQKDKVQNLSLSIDESLLKETLNEINILIGLEQVKTETHELIKLIRYFNEIGKDVLHKMSLHTIFSGNPGTGKTTMARLFGKLFKSLGILERGHVVECSREDLVGQFIGQTAPKTQKIIDSAMGGVLFIDEAYSIVNTESPKDFGSEAIEVLLKNMEDKRGKFIIIAAGYPDNMKEFLESNPGLKSRFDKTLNFTDYSVDELVKIANFMFNPHELQMDIEAQAHLKEYVEHIYQFRDKYFGNAREIRKIVEEVTRKQQLRMAAIPAKDRDKNMINRVLIDDIKHLIPDSDSDKKTTQIGFKIKD